MMSNNLDYKSFQNAQIDIIQSFCIQTNCYDNKIAENYLTAANWDKDEAIQLFFKKHPKYINLKTQNESQIHPGLPSPSEINDGKGPELSNFVKTENELEFFIEDAFVNDRNNHQPIPKCLDFIYMNLKNAEKNFRSFLSQLKNKPGIIMVINDTDINQIQEILKQLNENSYVLQNCVIYPVLNYFSIGKKCVELLCLENYPCYIFCKYKNDNYIYFIQSIVGCFYNDSLINLIRKCQPQQKCKLIKIKNENNKNNLNYKDNLGNKSFDDKTREKRNRNIDNIFPKYTRREIGLSNCVKRIKLESSVNSNSNQYNINHNNILNKQSSCDNLLRKEIDIDLVSNKNDNEPLNQGKNHIVWQNYNNSNKNCDCKYNKNFIDDDINNSNKVECNLNWVKINPINNINNDRRLDKKCNNAINNYSSRLNKSVDLQIDEQNNNKEYKYQKNENNNKYNFQINNEIINNQNVILRNKSEDIKIEKRKEKKRNTIVEINRNNNNNFINVNNNNNYINIIVNFEGESKKHNIEINPEKTIKDLLNEIYLRFYNTNIEFCQIFYNSLNLRKIDKSKKIKNLFMGNSLILILYKNVKGGICFEKQINIKFLKLPGKKSDKGKYCINLSGLLKLCLLKEISSKLNDKQIAKLSGVSSSILEILKNGKIKSDKNNEIIIEILKSIKGNNIINFSRYVDKAMDLYSLEKIFTLLNGNDFYEINDIKNRLTKYNEYIKFFETEFENAKKNSIFEFSLISLVIIERKDFDLFERERRNCPNRVEKILFHGTSVDPISSILTGRFNRAINHLFGEGVYHGDSLDYCWFYGSEKGNRKNVNKIPKENETFSLISSFIYYNKNGEKKVNDSSYTPKKNEINIGTANVHTGIVDDYNYYNLEKELLFKEYVIYDLNQICSFIGAKLKRDKFCVIWRDPNFSPDAVQNNQYDELFKNFLKKRLEYINNFAKFNCYTCLKSEEALELISRKKYNKIILISNFGPDYGGKKFIEDARKILKNDVITLFIAYNKDHLNWIQNFKNALYSNDATFYERYLNCFDGEDETQIKDSLNNLKELMESHYNVNFNFDDNFLDYPLFKNEGFYSNLTF